MRKSSEFSPAMCFSSKVSPGISPEGVKAAGTAEACPERHLVPFTSCQSGWLGWGKGGATEEVRLAKDSLAEGAHLGWTPVKSVGHIAESQVCAGLV